MSRTNNNPAAATVQARPSGDRRDELERIKAAKWPANESADDRKQRIAGDLAEWRNRPAWNFLVPLDAETIRYIAESPGVYEDQE